MKNSIVVIHPCKYEGIWVFDDEKVGLIQEPFVSGTDDIIERMVSGIRNAGNGFSLLFSSMPFPGHQIAFEWRREEMDGNWHYAKNLDMEGRLCPALFKYFERAPTKLYAQFKAKKAC